MLNTIKKVSLKRFDNIFKKIAYFNNVIVTDVKFDMASLKNIKYNMKITGDTSFLNNYFKRTTNVVSLKKIIKSSYLNAKQDGNGLLARLNSISNNINNKDLVKLVKSLDKRFNKNSYLLERHISFDTNLLAHKQDDEVKEILNNYIKDFKYRLKCFEVAEFNIDAQYELLISELIDLANTIYKKEESTSKFKNNKVVAYIIKKFNNKFHKLKPTVVPDKVTFATLFRKENFNKLTLKTYFLGNDEHKGFITTFIIYFLLILFGFVYLYPILYMLGYSFMSVSDLVNPNVNYIPTQLETQNYIDAAQTLNYWSSLGQTLLVSVLPAICQTISCSLMAWGLARYKFKGKKILFGLVIFTFLIPSCLTMLPTVSLYAKFHITGSVLAYVLPALFGQGIKSAVFILIFYQYFKALPKAIIEAAQIDGANDFVVFIRIALPAARSGILLTILLSIVWYYNETVLASLFFGSNIQTLPLGLENFKASFDAIMGGDSSSGKSINEAIYMAGTMLNIIPLLLLYFFTQKYFIQGVDKAGITGE